MRRSVERGLKTGNSPAPEKIPICLRLPIAFLRASLGLFLPTAAIADVEPTLSPIDSRFATVRPVGLDPIRVSLTAGRDLDVLMPPGEHVRSVVVDDTTSVRVSVPEGEDGLVLSGLRPLAATGITVSTSIHVYRLAVSTASSRVAPWVVRIESSAPPPHTAQSSPQYPGPGNYKLSGAKALWPVSIRDDGAKTYLVWGPAQAIPAVFGLSEVGQEEMVDGNVRDGAFVIDRVYSALVLRIDKAEASAKRVAAAPVGKP